MSLELAFAEMCELVGADVLEGVERTRTADLSSLHVIIHALRGLPEVANPAYLVRFLCSALHRIALPVVSEWCQEQVDGASPIPLHVSLEGHSLRLDFSHLSQTGWIAHRPSAQREAISRWLHTPLSDVGDEARRAALRKGLLRGF